MKLLRGKGGTRHNYPAVIQDSVSYVLEMNERHAWRKSNISFSSLSTTAFDL